MTPEKNNLLTELGDELKSLLEKYEEHLATSPELTVVRTKLQEAKARVEQEFAKYATSSTVEPFKATQTEETKPSDEDSQNEQDTEETQLVTVPGESQTVQIETTSTDTSRNGELAPNTPSAQPEQTTTEPQDSSESVLTIE